MHLEFAAVFTVPRDLLPGLHVHDARLDASDRVADGTAQVIHLRLGRVIQALTR
jgi:hypothetical protein